METRPAHLRAALHLLRRRHGASRFARCRTEKTWRPVQSQEIQRPGNLLRQPAREIRAGINGSLGERVVLNALAISAALLSDYGNLSDSLASSWEKPTPLRLGATLLSLFTFARCSCARSLGNSHLH